MFKSNIYCGYIELLKINRCTKLLSKRYKLLTYTFISMITLRNNNKIIRKADKLINNSTMTYAAHT